MSSLNAFGAIFSFAIEMEGKLRDYYKNIDATRTAESEKRRTTLERVRRENVTEIKLEPIEGLDEADYVFNFEDTTSEGQAINEEAAAEFYEDVAPKINVREAQRALERCGKQHRALTI